MATTKTAITGGVFQDSEGNPLSLGYLVFELNQDSSVSGVGNVCSGITITVPLNSAGSVASSPTTLIWATDVLSPVNAFYKVTGFTAQGQPAWGPNNQQITSGGVGGGTFDLGTWVPNQVFSWTPSIQPLTLKTGGVLNGSQSLLNLVAGSNLTAVDNGSGTVTLAVTGITGITLKTGGTLNGSQVLLNLVASTGISLVDNGSGTVTVTNTLPSGAIATGQNIIDLPPLNITLGAGTQGTINTGGATNSIVQYIPGTDLWVLPTHWTMSFRTVSASTVVQAVLAKCAIGSLTVISTTPITFSGNPTPTLAPAGTYTSDSIALTLDTSHDYYLILNTSTGLLGISQSGTAQSGVTAGVYVETSNFLSTSPLTFTGGTLEAGKSIIVQFLSA